MVKGIILKVKPEMDKYSSGEILGKLDPLNLIGSPEEFEAEKGMVFTKRVYGDKEFTIISYTTDNALGYNLLWEIFEVIKSAAEDIMKPIKYSDTTLILAYQKKIENSVIEELLRVATFFLGTFGPDKAKELTFEYINTCLIW